MATEIKGQLPCPDCGSTQPVKYDGRKYFINCGECRTLTSYQSKVAKARIEQKLQPKEEEPLKEESPKEKPITPEKLNPRPVKTPSFWESLDELF